MVPGGKIHGTPLVTCYIAMENGHFSSLIYPLKMVIFHCLFYVYQASRRFCSCCRVCNSRSTSSTSSGGRLGPESQCGAGFLTGNPRVSWWFFSGNTGKYWGYVWESYGITGIIWDYVWDYVWDNNCWLAVDLPLWKMMEWVTLGMMTCPIYGKINFMFQTTNQIMTI